MTNVTEIDSKNITLSQQVGIFVDAYYNDNDFQLAFGGDTGVGKFHLYIIFLYFCSYNKLFGYPSETIRENDDIVGLINYNNKNPLTCTIKDIRRYKFFHFCYNHLLNPKIRYRIDKYSKCAHSMTNNLMTYDLIQIGIRKKAQGKGYIRELIQALEIKATTDDKVNGLTVSTYSKKKCELYESLGFKLNQYIEDLETRVWTLIRELSA